MKKYAAVTNPRFKYLLPDEERDSVHYCSSCSKEITGRIYRCPTCHALFCGECAVHSIGGATCPNCEEVTFLQVVI